MSHILIATGGTGGHMFPAASIAEGLVSQGQKVHFITDQRGSQFLPKRPKFSKSIYNLSALGSRHWWSIPLVTWQICCLTLAVLFYFLTSRPSKVIGFGGYVSYPVLLMAKFFRVPYFIHEQNSVMGRVNRKFSDKATKVMTSFPETKFANENAICTGLPVRDPILKLKKTRYKSPVKVFNLLIIGGSQGAGVFSDVLPKAVSLLSFEHRNLLSIVQQCRAEDMHEAEQKYQEIGVRAQLSPFIENIEEQLHQAHLVISRAGASSVSELTVAGRPVILVPYPYATDNHQVGNAEYISSHQGGWMITQENFTPEQVAKFLSHLMDNPETLSTAASAIKNLSHGLAANHIIKQVLTN